MVFGKLTSGVLLSSLFLTLVGCASAVDMEDLQARVDSNTLQLKKLSQQSASGAVSQSNGQMADIENRLDQQKARMATLRGRLDVIDHRLDQLMERIDQEDAKIKGMGTSPVASSSVPTPGTPTSPPAPGSSSVAESGVPPSSPAESVVTAETVYRQAMNDYQQGHYDLAKKEFSQVTSQFPTSHLSSSAAFWVGQSDFNLKNYDQSVIEFKNVIKKYPDSPKRAVAYFKMARAYELLGKKKFAIHNYRRVLELFPLDRQLDELAKRRLSRLE
ncbi:MAG: tetratricopeptide repeat protein [Leptospirales bacterium]